MKSIEKGKRVHAGILRDGDIAVTFDGHALYKIPGNKFYINFNKIPENQLKADSLFGIDTQDAVKTNELRKINNTTLVKLKSEKAYAWVDEKLLKFFNKNCTFAISISNPRLNPIKIFENKECVGIVLPFILED